MMFNKPGAWVPLALSLVMAVILSGYLVTALTSGGIVRETDEGVVAHLFQLWLPLEAAMIVYFGVTRFPIAPKQASFILLLQILAVLAVCAPVFYFNL